MKMSVVVAGLIWPALAFGQQMYTNADLEKFSVPGAYTNEDLRRLPPLSVQKEPAAKLPAFVPAGPSPELIAQLQSEYDGLKRSRDAIAFELQYERRMIDFSDSPFAGDTRNDAIGAPRLGYSTIAPWIRELEKRIALTEHQMDEVETAARRAGVYLDRR